LRAGDIRRQIVTMDSLLENTIALSNGIIADPLYDLLFLQNRGPKCTPGPTSLRVSPGDYNRRYRQDLFYIPHAHQAMLPVAQLLWPLFIMLFHF